LIAGRTRRILSLEVKYGGGTQKSQSHKNDSDGDTDDLTALVVRERSIMRIRRRTTPSSGFFGMKFGSVPFDFIGSIVVNRVGFRLNGAGGGGIEVNFLLTNEFRLFNLGNLSIILSEINLPCVEVTHIDVFTISVGHHFNLVALLQGTFSKSVILGHGVIRIPYTCLKNRPPENEGSKVWAPAAGSLYCVELLVSGVQIVMMFQNCHVGLPINDWLDLSRNTVRTEEVIVIPMNNHFTATLRDSKVSLSPNALSLSQMVVADFHFVHYFRSKRRLETVIHNDDLDVGVILLANEVEGSSKELGALVGRNNDTN